MKELKIFWKNLNKVYFLNFAMVSVALIAIAGTFYVQFKVEKLQDEIVSSQNQIAGYEDQIALLEVEWTYLTRPARIRSLAANYLKDNGYTLASQIKNGDEMEKFFASNSGSSETQVALNF